MADSKSKDKMTDEPVLPTEEVASSTDENVVMTEEESAEPTETGTDSKEEAPTSVDPGPEAALASSEPAATNSPIMKSRKPKWFFAAAAAALVLLIAGGAYGYLGVYMQSPENIWKSSLKTTRDGLKAFVGKGPTDKKGAKLSGSFKMTMPVAADGSLSGALYDKSSAFKLNAGASGVRADLEIRTLPVNGSKTPDVYLNLSGIKSLAGLISSDPKLSATIDALDGKWLVADHTLIDQLEQSANSANNTNLTNETPEQLMKDLQDVEKKVVTVVNDRLLSDDKAKAVVIVKDKLAKEDFKGRRSQHLRVQVQKKQLHEFAVAMKDALKSSKVNTWLLGSDTGKTFEQATDFDSLLKSIDSANYDRAVADVWVDTAYRTIRDVRIYDSPTDTKSYVDFMFDYKGGDDYPFLINVVANDTNGSQTISMGMTVNNKTDKIAYAIIGTGKDSRGNKTIDVTASLDVVPTDDKLNVEKPAGATNIVNLFGGILGQLQNAQKQLKVVNPVNSSFLDDTQLQ